MKQTKGPRSRSSRTPAGTQPPSHIPQYQVSFDKEAFSNLLRAHGVRMIHCRAIPNPKGMASKGDNHGVMTHRGSSDNFIYQQAGVVQVLFTNNNTQVSLAEEGVLNFSTAYITLPPEYEDSDNPVIVANWDRFYLADIETRVVDRQFVEASTTGEDRLHYPATCIEHLIDADGIEYKMGKDFTLTSDGNIKWLGQNRPGWNATTGRGKVYAVRYRYTPFFVVSHIVHEIRVAQITDKTTYERKLERLPYQCQVVRERVFRDTAQDPQAPVDHERFQYSPPTGGFLGPK